MRSSSISLGPLPCRVSYIFSCFSIKYKKWSTRPGAPYYSFANYWKTWKARGRKFAIVIWQPYKAILISLDLCRPCFHYIHTSARIKGLGPNIYRRYNSNMPKNILVTPLHFCFAAHSVMFIISNRNKCDQWKTTHARNNLGTIWQCLNRQRYTLSQKQCEFNPSEKILARSLIGVAMWARRQGLPNNGRMRHINGVHFSSSLYRPKEASCSAGSRSLSLAIFFWIGALVILDKRKFRVNQPTRTGAVRAS